ncbi:hypothetical protein L6452_38614 [Arctium lappa]|uniref:Uncharacterized protein n=1 Tax=Arctium lappa TaxID=4217 RepID=A0ACB8XPL6_ARCLA|nr:hypothetical protein L6452_38614 [Arctium lappa]
MLLPFCCSASVTVDHPPPINCPCLGIGDEDVNNTEMVRPEFLHLKVILHAISVTLSLSIDCMYPIH